MIFPVSERPKAIEGDRSTARDTATVMFVELEPVAAAMNDIGIRWAFAGGWAIDLWRATRSRPHHDIEVVVHRHDQGSIHAALRPSWDLFCLDPPGGGWQPWDGHSLSEPAFQLQARRGAVVFDIFTETVDDDVWLFRRDHRISRPAVELVTVVGDGVPVVRPAIQLLYMAKGPAPKNGADFAVSRPSLADEEATWLAAALALTLPTHPWLADL